MKKNNEIVSKIMLGLVLSFLLFLFIQSETNFIKIPALKGNIIYTRDTNLTVETWFDGSYAQTKEKYLNENFGCRNFFVRLRNQFQYSAYKKSNVYEVTFGKNGYLFEAKYLREYNGYTYYGDNKLKQKIAMIKQVQDSLAARGIYLLVVLAPNKADYHSEFIPSPYNVPAPITNSSVFIREIENKKVNFINFNQWFLQLKNKTKFPLYPQTGTHWSNYGAHLAFDSLLHYMEVKSSKKLNRFSINKVELSSQIQYPDADAEESLNLLQNIEHFDLAYPNIKWNNSAINFKPNVMAIGDSYWLNFFYAQLHKPCFNEYDFWYYNREIKKDNQIMRGPSPLVADFKKAIANKNFIIIEATSPNLLDIGWGFIETLHFMFAKQNASTAEINKLREKEIDIIYYKKQIKSNKIWLQKIKKEAIEKNEKLDDWIYANALYLYELKQLQNK